MMLIRSVCVLLSSCLLLACASSGDPSPDPKPKPDPKPTADIDKPKPPREKGVPEPIWESVERFTMMCADALSDAKAVRDRVVAVKDPSSDEALAQLAALFAALDRAGGWSSLMFNVHPDEALRGAAKVCQQNVSKFATEVSLDRAVYQVVAAQKPTDPDAKRFVEQLLRDYRHAGVDRDDKTRKRLEAIGDELTKLMQDFRMRVTKDVKTLQVDPKRLAGLPEDFVKAHKPDADGKVTLTTDYPDFFPVQRYADDAALRRDLYRLFAARGYPDNGPVLKKVLALRAEKAKLLGYKTWAEYNAADKMVKTADTVSNFIAEVAKLAKPRSKKDLAELLKAKKKDHKKAKRIEAWDRFYYMSKVRQAKFAYDARQARAYFPYHAVKKGIFDLYAELFGLIFERLETAEVWHPSVEAWAMRYAADDAASGHKKGDLMGVVYLDMHPRPGKYKHAAMFSPETGTKGGALPVGTLVCNFPDPGAKDGDGKGLLEHSQVITFLHEFGHLIHHELASGSKYVRNASINIEWDFVEAPSQLLEEWGWDHAVLSRFAKHADTGKPIPAELVKKMKAAEEFGKGAEVMRQVFYAGYSFHLHNRDPAKVDLDKFTDAMYKKYSPYPRIEGGHVYANFGHLMGYSSAYYTYQWSLTLAKDMFTRFDKEGLLNPKVAQQYRDAVLRPGSLQDAAQLVENFLGRKSNLDAYRKWLLE